mgnify:CR=1 FL=1
MKRLLIKDIRYVYCMDEADTFLEHTDIYIEGNVIKQIGKDLRIPADGIRVIDGAGKLALPGFVNTHHHFYQNITRNIPVMQKGNLLGWLLYSYGAWGKYAGGGCESGSQAGGGGTADDRLYYIHGFHVFLPSWKAQTDGCRI